jgi:hypothetical protein
MIIYFGGAHCAFDFLRALPACMAGLLFPPGSCVLGFEAVFYTPSTCFYCSLVSCVFSFFPFWVPIFFGPSSTFVGLAWPILGLLGTWISGGYVSPCSASFSVVLFGTSWVMDGIIHSLGDSLMTMLISPFVIQ